MNEVLVQKFGAIAPIFQNRPTENNLSAGIQASFPLLGFSGKVWQIRFRGEKHALMRADGDGPVNSIECVILKAAAVVSKTYYANSYVDGSVEAPDCFSTDGIKPEANVKARQNPVCATCPHNAWGSRPPAKPGDPPRKGKACADTKRLAIVMASQLLDGTAEQMGAMLLRVPPASLQDVAMYGITMARHGYPEYSIVTRISFDTKEVFPKLVFGAVRALTEDEGRIVIAMRDSEQTDRVLAERDLEAAAASQPETVPASPFEQPGRSEAWTMQAGSPEQTHRGGQGVASPTPSATHIAQPPQASPAASVSPQTPTQPQMGPNGGHPQPEMVKQPPATPTGMTGQAPSQPAQTAGANGNTSSPRETKPTPAPSAPSSVPTSHADQPFLNTGGTATFAGTPTAFQNGAHSTGQTQMGPENVGPDPTNTDPTNDKSFEEQLNDKLAALLPS